MIRSFDYGDVRYFRMARSLFGRPVYWTGVYYADGLLVDTGPPNLWREMERLCRELQVRQCVITHHHEDHSGNHGLLRERFHITPRAHAVGVSLMAQPDPNPRLYRRVAWGERMAAPAEPVGEWLETPRFLRSALTARL